MSSKYREPADSFTLWAWGIGSFIIVAFIVFIIFAVKSENSQERQKQANQTYSGDEQGAPVAELNEKFFDAGPLKNKTDPVTHSFTLTNAGKSDLIVNKLTTSCHCTTAQLTYNGESSKKWGMASGSDWQVAIKPGGIATISIEYDPTKMISDGLIKRGIYIGTNDPKNPELTYEMDMENNL